MTSVIVVVSFCIVLIGLGVYIYTDRKKLFNIPDYKTDKYKIKIWCSNFVLFDLGLIDSKIDKLIEEVHKTYPGISKENLSKLMSILNIYYLSDTDSRLFLEANSITDFKNLTVPYRVMENGKIFILRDGVEKENYIFLRKITNSAINGTALFHEIVHYILKYYHINGAGDNEHKDLKYWEKEGWLSKI